jgi:hypothetical protein
VQSAALLASADAQVRRRAAPLDSQSSIQDLPPRPLMMMMMMMIGVGRSLPAGLTIKLD